MVSLLDKLSVEVKGFRWVDNKVVLKADQTVEQRVVMWDKHLIVPME